MTLIVDLSKSKISRILFVCALSICMFYACKNQTKTEKPIKWSPEVEDKLNDTSKVNYIVDSLKILLNKASTDTESINIVNDIAQYWRGESTLILSNETYRKSKELNYEYGEADALSRQSIYFYRKFDFNTADSLLEASHAMVLKIGSKKLLAQSYHWLGEFNKVKNNSDTAEYFFNKSIEIAKEIKDTIRLITVCSSLGDMYRVHNKYDEAIAMLTATVELSLANHEKMKLATCYSYLGDIYRVQNNYSMAMEYFNKALLIAYDIKDKTRIVTCLSSIGNIYNMQGDAEKAIENLEKSTVIAKEINDKLLIIFTLSSTGEANITAKKYDKAEKYFREALQLATAIDESAQMAFCYNSLGRLYLATYKYDLSIEYNEKAIQIAKEYQFENREIDAYISMGECYIIKSDYASAKKYSLLALEKSQSNCLLENTKLAAHLLYRLYTYEGDYKNALRMHELYLDTKEKIGNEEEVKKFAALEYQGKEDLLKIEQEKKNAVFEAEKLKKEEEFKHQRTILIAVSFGLILLIGLAFIIFRSLQQNKKANKIITEQKHLVEEKQKEIIDSINYAKRIQYTLLAHNELLKENLNDHFVYFNPKDIVSGDFYWATKHKDKFYLAVCDSTGHGVPGAFMSLLNISFLNEAITERGIEQPNEILNYVRERLTTSVSKEGQKDGFDGILLCIDKSKNNIQYAAANNAPLIINNGEFKELPKDRMPVGVGERKENFTLHTIEVIEGDMLYLYTDGYADQFGGERGKKFKYKPLNEMLAKNSETTLSEQSTLLSEKFNNWKGSLEQVDDVLIVGIRL